MTIHDREIKFSQYLKGIDCFVWKNGGKTARQIPGSSALNKKRFLNNQVYLAGRLRGISSDIGEIRC